MKIKAVFYKATISKNEYKEDVEAWVQQFTSGVELKTVSFKDKIAGGQNVDNESVYIYCFKNTNTLTVESGWKITLPSQPGSPSYLVKGIDAKYGVQMGLVLYAERVK